MAASKAELPHLLLYCYCCCCSAVANHLVIQAVGDVYIRDRGRDDAGQPRPKKTFSDCKNRRGRCVGNLSHFPQDSKRNYFVAKFKWINGAFSTA